MSLPDRNSRNGYYDFDPATKQESRSTIWLAFKALILIALFTTVLGYFIA